MCRIPVFVLFLGVSFIFHVDSWANSGVSPNVLVLPTGPGSLGGVGENVNVNLNMGLMTYSIPIRVPAGRQGHSPQLRLTYSSSSGSGTVGMGWSLGGVPSIERLTVRGLPQYGQKVRSALQRKDRFYAGGELVHIKQTPFYRSRFEGSFIRYRWHHTGDQKGYWTAERKDGSIAFYGAAYTPQTDRKVDVTRAQVDLQSHVFGLQGTFRWMLRSEVDAHGNRIEYTYSKVGSQVYISEIAWVFAHTGKPLYQIFIDYEDRPDPISNGKAGFDLVTTKRVQQIRILSTGKAYRSYLLTYDPKSTLSRLIRVAQVGNDGTSVHPVQFSMQYSPADYDSKQARIVDMPTSLSHNFVNGNSDLIDMNGDGLPDVIDTSKSTHRFHVNTMTVRQLKQEQHDFARPYENRKETSGASLSHKDVQMLDYNGDGFTDLVSAVTKTILLNKGKGYWEDSSGALQSNFPSPGANPNRRFFDFNGDKAIDVMEILGQQIVYWVSDGKGKWIKVQGDQHLGADFAKDRMRLIDMNGDGLSDAVQIFGGKVRYRKYFGYGKWSKDWIVIPVQGLTQSLADRVRFADINGDGMADMVAFIADSIRFFINRNGRSFIKGPPLNKTFKGSSLPDSNPSQVSIRIVDMNGNGSRDIVWLDKNGKVKYLELFRARPNLLTHISNGIGKRIQVTYGSSVQHALQDKSSGKPWKSKLPMAFIVVNRIKTWASRVAGRSDPKGACPITQTIRYHDGYYDGIEKQFRGFRTVRSTFENDASSGCTVQSIGKKTETLHFYVGDGNTAAGDNDVYYRGKLKSTLTSGASHGGKNVDFSLQTYRWKECSVAGAQTSQLPAIRYICNAAVEVTVREGETQASKWKTTRSEFSYDGYGNQTRVDVLGLVDKQGDERYFKYSYINPENPNDPDPQKRWFSGFVQRSEICEKEQGPCASMDTFYDGPAFVGLPAGSITHGNVTRRSAKPGPEQSPIHLHRAKWDAFGNLLETQDPRGHRNRTEWDPLYHRFSISNAHLLKDRTLIYKTEWDYRYGVVRFSTDWNGNKTLYGYDAFGRLLSSIKPGDPLDKPSTVYTYHIQEPLSWITTKQRKKVGGPFVLEKRICFDGMGRLLQRRTRLDTGRWIVQGHKVYNSRSLQARYVRSYLAKDAKCAFDLPSGTAFTATHYDGLGRTIRKIREDLSEARYVYRPMQIVFYDPEDNRVGSPHVDTPRTDILDGLGRLTQRIERLKPGHSILTSFVWSALNIYGRSVLVKRIDTKGHIKKQSADYLGRVLKSTDEDRSTTEYTYDVAGNLIRRKDARKSVVEMTYDALNRVQSIQQKDRPETRISYQYDVAAKGIPWKHAKNLKGRLVASTYPHAQDLFGYDQRGRTVAFRRTVLGHSFDFAMHYDLSDRITKRTFPDGRTITYERDGANRLISIPGLIPSLEYNARGLSSGWTFANGLKTSMKFDVNDRLTEMHTPQIASFRYAYDRMNNLTSIEQTIAGLQEKQVYTYDSLYRLTQAQLGNRETLRYAYDDLYNLTSKVSNRSSKSAAHVGTYTYDPKRVHATSKAGRKALSYDAAGYVKTFGKQTYTWDFLGRLRSVQDGNQVLMKAWYAAESERFLKWEHNIHTLYVTDDYEIRDGLAYIYLFMGKKRVVAWKNLKGARLLWDDLAPASKVGSSLISKPDSTITAGDAWLYHAAQKGMLKLPLRKRGLKLQLTHDMLAHRLQQMLDARSPRRPSDTSKVYYHTDHLGSTRVVTDASGRIVGTRDFHPFGTVRSQTGHIFSYGFMTTELDRSTGLNFGKARYLSTFLGRWISADPAFDQIRSTEDEWNSYAYAVNNPIRMVDTLGTSSAEFDDFGPPTLEGALVSIMTLGEAYKAVRNRNRGGGNRLAAAGVFSGVVSTVGLGLQVSGAVSNDSAMQWVGVSFELGGAILASLVSARSEEKANARESQLTSQNRRLQGELQVSTNSNTELRVNNVNLQARNQQLKQERSGLRQQLQDAHSSILHRESSLRRRDSVIGRQNSVIGRQNSTIGRQRSLIAGLRNRGRKLRKRITRKKNRRGRRR